jgi:tetratricopeptide (TPR) repeat protein
MNSTATLVVSDLLAAGTAFAITASRGPEAPEPAGRPDVGKELAELRDAHRQLLQRVEALANTPAPAVASSGAERSAVTQVSPEQIAAAVDAYMQKHAGAKTPAVGAAAGAPQFDLDQEFDLLRGVGYDANPALWKRLHASGKGREALARFEAAVKADPKNVTAQMEYANALLAYMREDQGDYNLAIRADRAFDDVLALDDKHWEARFTKAVSYSFWPPITGKPKQAIGHLETLVAQQDTMPPQAHEANTYVILGNLLESSGDSAKAKKIWRKGARRHPENQDLAARAK